MALSMSAVLKGFFSNKHIIGRSIGATSCCARLTQNSARGFATQKHSSTGTVPPVPKRPPSGFILFAADARKIVLKENPALTATEVIKAVAGKWKTADDNTRNKYAALARERFEQYQKEKAAYDSQLTEQQKEALEDVRLDKKLKLTKRKLNDKLKELDKPKGARSAYVLFSTEMRKKLQEKPPKLPFPVMEPVSWSTVVTGPYLLGYHGDDDSTWCHVEAAARRKETGICTQS
ncbi:transcription factor A, mitochondrial isoform X4 [Rhipicephalus microplus]|uniref:transcription factor A, mitochondrial isoform X4 n=1 Tax=Rhipicephalus microplus TaxID=6941 RepID=UPI001889AB11|nr:transcription factor A, mitochondrial-like isoform X4 [Rhipicephalus microplus]